MTTEPTPIERARQFWPKGSTVYTILRHVSRSGMQRTIGMVSLNIIDINDSREPSTATGAKIDVRHPNYIVSQVIGLLEDREREGVKISGFGMDMGFSIAYDLGRALYGDGYALKHRWL